MKEFIKLVTANVFALCIAGVVFLGAGFFLILGLGTAVSQELVLIEKGSVLVVDLGMNLSDAPKTETIEDVVREAVEGPATPSHYLLEFIDAIDHAAYDDRISAIFLKGSFQPVNYGSGFAALKEVGRALERFKSQGKTVHAYAVNPTIRDYFLLSKSDDLTLNPFGLVSMNGLAANMMYFKNAFDKFGIGVQTTRVGKYKSAVEAFTNDHMSDADREQIDALLTGLWDEIVGEVAFNRKLDPVTVAQIGNQDGFFSAEMALERGLIDQAGYYDEVITALMEKYGTVDFGKSQKSFRQISMAKYIADVGFEKHANWDPKHHVAVVYAEGNIVDGAGVEGQVGGDKVARELRKLRQDEKVKAVVLRVNSPGGSAVASEVIQREIRLLKKDKPVVVSMGSYAASGGYWISAYSDKIYAEPSTITGSIGVFGLLFNFEGAASDLGITFDGVKTSTFADLFTMSRPKTEEEMALIQQFTDFIYDSFVEKVSSGRDLTEAQVKEIAQGRVWSGVDAKEIGLVDEIGGLQNAIDHAVELAELGDDWEIRQVPEPKDISQTIEDLLEEATNGAPTSQSADVVSLMSKKLEEELSVLRSFNDPRFVYARLPFRLDY